MTMLSFLINASYKPLVLYFNHGTKHGKNAEKFIVDFCTKNELRYYTGQVCGNKPKGRSEEDWWREQRYKFLDKFEGPIATAHHLNDVAETYLFGALNGTPKLIPECRGKFIRPMLETSKQEIEKWAEKWNVKYIQDPSNYKNNHRRNVIRNEMMPIVDQINPGFLKVIKKKLKEQREE
jgi:tRNA(Ile)-lysidine synthase